MAWKSGQAWRVANGLNQLNAQLRRKYPHAVPPATRVDAWGSIADSVHSTSSDHFPHFYAALGSTAVVCARDFPHAPSLGMDGHVITEALRISRDPRIGYLICDRRITGPNHGWRWDPYTGDDPHDTHFHVSSVHTAIADGLQAWALPGPGAGRTESTPVPQGANMPDVNLSWGETLSAYLHRIEPLWAGNGAQLAAMNATLAAIAKAQGVSQADLDNIQSKVGTATISDAQIALIADRLIASGANGLTAADHAAVVADVKQALAEGTGG